MSESSNIVDAAAGKKAIIASRGGAGPFDATPVVTSPGPKRMNVTNVPSSKTGDATQVADIGQAMRDAATKAQVSAADLDRVRKRISGA